MTAFDEFLTDGIGFNDTLSAHTEFNVALEDGIGFDDTPLIELGVALEDGIGFDDAIKDEVAVFLTDGIGFNDSIEALVITRHVAAPVDGIGFNDILQVTIGVALQDGIGFNDDIITNPTDGIGFNDILQVNVGVALVDGIGFNDAIGVGLGVSPVDGIGFNDTLAAGLAYGVSIVDGIGFNDSIAVAMAYGVSLVDGIGFDDLAGVSEFPRLVLPMRVSDLWSPGALKDMSRSGLLQVRATKAAGWSWQEEWGNLNIRNSEHQDLTAFIKNAWNRGTIFDTVHALVPGSGISPNGLGTPGVLVKGASQIGEELLTDGWPNNTSNCVRAGDVIRIAADNGVYLIVEDADSNGLGEVTICVSPNLRKSPPDNGAVITTDVLFTTTIMSNLQQENYRSPLYFEGMSVVMTEALTP